MKYRYSAAVVVLLLSPVACDGKTSPAAGHDPNHGGTADPLATLDGFEGEIALTAKGSLGGGPSPSRAQLLASFKNDTGAAPSSR